MTSLESIGTRIRKLNPIIPLIISILVILANTAVIHSSILGTVASTIYVVLTGYLLGKAFLSSEEALARYAFGVFLTISLFILVGTAIVVLYLLNTLGLTVVLLAPAVLLIPRMILQKPKLTESESKTENTDGVPYFSPIYGVFLFSIAYCAFLLVKARSGWVYGTVWTVVSPSFFVAYFLAAVLLLGIIMFSNTRAVSKVLLTITFSLISIMIFSIVLYPGNYGDAFYHMASAQTIFDEGSLKREYGVSPLFLYYWLLKEKALALLTAIVAKIFMIDVYWVHTFMTPALWGVFIPLTAYLIAKILGFAEKVSVLAAFLTTFYSSFVSWGSRSTGNGLGLILFFVSLYFSLRYLQSNWKSSVFFSATLTAIASGLTHPFTGLAAFIFIILAMVVKRHQTNTLKSPLKAHLWMSVSLVILILGVLATFGISNLIYLFWAPSQTALEESGTAFSLPKLLKSDVWELVFGEYVTFTFKDLLTFATIPFLGILGMAYALKRKNSTRNDRMSALFMLLAFLIIMIDYRIMQYAMTNVLFTPARIWALSDLIAIPFAALAISSAVGSTAGEGSRKPGRVVFAFRKWASGISAGKVFTGALIVFSLSAFAVSSLYKGYDWLGGLHPTQLEVDAVKYIDEHTNGGYVVIADPTTTMVGQGFTGYYNLEKFYFYSDLYLSPSVADMLRYMQAYKAGVGYFMLTAFRTLDADRIIASASQVFGLLKILGDENGQIYIFYYRIPPLPTSPDVNAFYWDTPPRYIIQNDRMRLGISVATQYINVEDYWGDVYESINLNSMMVNGQPVGNFTSAEYYNPSASSWITWNPQESVPFNDIPALAQTFQFRLRFQSGALVGVVERNNPSVELHWEGSQVSDLNLQVESGDFARLYIPGLVGGRDSYNVSSRDFGFFYTLSRTENVVLHPAYRYELNSSSLTYSQIVNYCGLTITPGYFLYDFYVHNNAKVDQWAYVEVWLPDVVYGGIAPPVSYSLDDGKTWNATSGNKSLRTLGGAEANWVVTKPRWLGSERNEIPTAWTFSAAGVGGYYELPASYTDSGGGQNRFFFGVYLPAGDRALVRLGAAIYNSRPLKIAYIFNDSDDTTYGVRNMREGVIKFYNYGGSSYVSGITVATRPTSVVITEDEAGKIKAILVVIPSNTAFSLLSNKGVDTTIDTNGDGIPDGI